MQNAPFIVMTTNQPMANIQVLHGPNLNLLGSREPGYYGHDNLESVNTRLAASANQLGHTLHTLQSNSETVLIDHIQQSAAFQTDFIIFNPAAFTHTSIALRDALVAVAIPFIEIHISNIYSREPFRKHSYFSDIAIGVVTGLGTEGYLLSLQYAHFYLEKLRS